MPIALIITSSSLSSSPAVRWGRVRVRPSSAMASGWLVGILASVLSPPPLVGCHVPPLLLPVAGLLRRLGLGGGGGRCRGLGLPALLSGRIAPRVCFSASLGLTLARWGRCAGAGTECNTMTPCCAILCLLNASMMVLARSCLPSGPRVSCLYCASRPHSSHFWADHLVLAHLLPPSACATAHWFLYTLSSSAKCL